MKLKLLSKHRVLLFVTAVMAIVVVMAPLSATAEAIATAEPAFPESTTESSEAADRMVHDDIEKPEELRPATRWAWLGVSAGIYAAVGATSYLAWYRNSPTHPFKVEQDGWLGVNTYAGGADKFGHFYSNMLLTRGVGGILHHGGFTRGESLAWAAGLSTLFHLGVEVKDGFHFGFSVGDLTANLLGTAFGVAMTMFPELDRAIDLRLEYWPSSRFVERAKTNGVWAFQTDYEGQTYLLAFHLGFIDSLRDLPVVGLSRYLDVVVGFRSRGHAVGVDRRQHVFGGVALNVQEVLDSLFGPVDSVPEGAGRTARRVGRFATDVYAIPYTTLPVAGIERHGRDVRR